jgi:alcohol dehydrogenase (cytochrome c)
VQGGLKGTPLEINGVLYYTAPDHAWAIDARTGRDIWHFAWPSKGGIHIGNRGPAVYGNWLYFLTPDCNIVSVNIKDGKERWHKTNCDLDQFYYGSVAPLVIRNHVIAGVSGDDLDRPGYISSYDPENGALQWRWYVVPQKKGDPGSETWPNEDAMKHGGGMTWQVPTYDPELNLLYVTTGNPQPVIAHKNREGDNLYTGSVVALNPDTGKMVWYFQASPHDTHDWDATQVPVLFDGEIEGKPRKLLGLAARNGYFFVLDRATGKNIVTSQYVPSNWAKGVGKNGTPIPDPAKYPQIDGALVSPNQGGATNWPPPTFNPKTGLFYVPASRAYSVYYIYDTDDNPQGWGGTDRGGGNLGSSIEAIDYKTGKTRWSHKWESGGRSGLMSTAGNLLFCGDGANNFVALNATTGDPLWHANLGASVSNGPMTYELDGTQYVVVTAGDSIWAFAML